MVLFEEQNVLLDDHHHIPTKRNRLPLALDNLKLHRCLLYIRPQRLHSLHKLLQSLALLGCQPRNQEVKLLEQRDSGSGAIRAHQGGLQKYALGRADRTTCQSRHAVEQRFEHACEGAERGEVGARQPLHYLGE